MIEREKFNSHISKIIRLDKEGHKRNMLMEISAKYPIGKDWYFMLDEFTYRMGFSFNVKECFSKREVSKGFIPVIKFYPDNSFEQPAGENSIGLKDPVTLDMCCKILTNEVVNLLE
jgi:hypothetical protein